MPNHMCWLPVRHRGVPMCTSHAHMPALHACTHTQAEEDEGLKGLEGAEDEAVAGGDDWLQVGPPFLCFSS